MKPEDGSIRAAKPLSRSRAKRGAAAAVWYLVATSVALFALLPFFWMIGTSLKSRGALLAIPIQWIPEAPTFDAYRAVFALIPFGRAIVNSLIVAAATTLITLASSSMAAYAFAKLGTKATDRLFGLYLATMMIPMQVTVIPLFILLSKLRLIGTFGGLLLPSVFNAFAVFMLRQQFLSLPDAYIDAAVIDGAGQGRVFAQIVLPMCAPVIATLVVITFMGAWNDYFWPLVVLMDKAKMTLTLALNQLNGQYSTRYNTLMAGSLISMLPILALYASAQKYFQTGLQLGGIKG
jgi:multiple sugar transport system permease protein